jgi:hypothetical protein
MARSGFNMDPTTVNDPPPRWLALIRAGRMASIARHCAFSTVSRFCRFNSPRRVPEASREERWAAQAPMPADSFRRPTTLEMPGW